MTALDDGTFSVIVPEGVPADKLLRLAVFDELGRRSETYDLPAQSE